jgi:hypothetical protein
MPEIEPLLKTLRLSGMLDTLSIRNKEAIENKKRKINTSLQMVVLAFIALLLKRL